MSIEDNARIANDFFAATGRGDHWAFAVRNGKLTNTREYVGTQALARAPNAAEAGASSATSLDAGADNARADLMPAMLLVLQMAMQVEVDPAEVAAWYRDTPIAEFGDLAAAQLVSLGRADEVIMFLRAIRDGKRG